MVRRSSRSNTYVVENQVSGSELLATEEGTKSTSIEGQIGHETAFKRLGQYSTSTTKSQERELTASIVHKNTLLGIRISAIGAHVEL